MEHLSKIIILTISLKININTNVEIGHVLTHRVLI